MGNDFGALPDTCNFNSTGQCGHPRGPVYSSRWLDNPTGQWGARLKWSGRSGWYAQAGVYDVDPMRRLPSNGFKLSTSGNTGLFFPVEPGYIRGQALSDYTGTHKFGAYLDTSNAPRLGESDASYAKHRNAYYVQLAQRIWKPGRERDT